MIFNAEIATNLACRCGHLHQKLTLMGNEGPGVIVAAIEGVGRVLTPKFNRALPSPLVFLVAVYLFCALVVSAHTALWMDEVIAVTAASQPTVRGVLHVIWVGTDFSPPTFHLLLHALPGLSVNPRVIARLPSILGVLGAGLCMYAIARRRFAAQLAAITFGATVASPLFWYAHQARQYALTTFLLAAALALWDGLPAAPGRNPARLFGLWAALAACISLHFYGVVIVGALVLCEVIWSVSMRKTRPAVWWTFAALVPVLLAWLPLSSHLRTIGRADQVGPEFYGHPSLGRLGQVFIDLAVGGNDQMLLYGGVVLAIVIGAMVRARPAGSAMPAPPLVAGDRNLVIIMVALAAIPVGAYALGALATGSFVARYAVGVTLLPGLLITIALATCPNPKLVALLLAPLVAITMLLQVAETFQTYSLRQVQAVVEQIQRPILVSDAQLYIELIGALPASDRARITYLATPAGLPIPDPTNENEVMRLATVDPRFRVTQFDRAMADPAGFVVLRTLPESTDLAFPQILRQHRLGRLVMERDAAQAFFVPSSPNAQASAPVGQQPGQHPGQPQ